METNNDILCACNGACQALANAMILDKNPESYMDPRIAVLLEDIDASGIEEVVQAIEIEGGKKAVIAGKDGIFMATGPMVLFVACLPREAFEGLRRD